LASFNLLLVLTPETQRARYSAIFQIVVTLALAGGAMFGGWLVTRSGYQAIFLSSGLGRLAAALLFARLIPTTENSIEMGFVDNSDKKLERSDE
jgi:predicted MFS family arabinose efflux permease